MKKISVILCALAATLPMSAQIYKDHTASPHERAVSIVKEMTLPEKVSLMKHESAAVPRLGIKQYNWWNEALHGVARAGLATVFPQPIGMAATFDDRMVYDVFTATSDEARAKNQVAKQNGPLQIYQGLTFWTPNVNIYRDPRWGRGHETYGEDPYLTSRMGTSVVRGLQGDSYEGGRYSGSDSPKYHKLHACAKHFAVHSGPEWNRHSYNAENISLRDLYETYLPAFKALVEDADVKEVMCAYNRYEGEPCCGSNRLLNGILRDEWGYKGIVLSDCWAINDFYEPGRHGTEPDAAHAVATAVRTGTDLECGQTYGNLVEAVEKGLISEETIDRSVIRLMEARYELGEMDDDSLVEWTKIPYSVVGSAEHGKLAEKVARESIVLLKNDGILPLGKDIKVGLVGPNANDSIMQWGNYNGFPTSTSTLYSALRDKLPEGNLVFVDGIDHTADISVQSHFANTCASNGKPGFDAYYWNRWIDSNDINLKENPEVTYSQTTPINLTTSGAIVWAPGVNLGGFSGLFKTTFTAPATEEIAFSMQTQGYMTLRIDGKCVFRGGNMKSKRAYVLKAEKGRSYDIEVTFNATEGDCASLNFDFGSQKPLDLASVTEQLKDCDVVIFAGGLSPMLEGEEMQVAVKGFRGGDREIIELPESQQRVLDALAKAGKRVVYVNYSGSAVALTDEAVPAEAVLQAWYPGQAGGEAVADVLLGEYNPGGKLPLTFYKSTSDLPDFEDYNMTNRTYRYFKGEPLYAFGHGLSYTTFDYGKGSVKKRGDNYELTVPVKNTGNMAGDEVVQVYIANPADAEGPKMQLRDFRRITLKPGESADVKFSLTPEQFNWYNPSTGDMQPLKGDCRILYGSSSDMKNLKTVNCRRK